MKQSFPFSKFDISASQGQLSIPSQTHHWHARGLITASADLTPVHTHHQSENVKTHTLGLLEQAGRVKDATKKTFMTPGQQITTGAIQYEKSLGIEALGTVTGELGPSYIPSVTAPLGNPMRDTVSLPEIYSNLGVDAGTGVLGDIDRLGLQVSSPPASQIQPHVDLMGMCVPGAQSLTMMPWHMFPHSTRENEIAGPVALGGCSAMVSDNWTGSLCWQREGVWVQAQALATEPVCNSTLLTWPKLLQIQLVKTAIFTLDIQAWIQMTNAPVTRIKCKPGVDGHEFDDLVKSLRNGGGYALAGWETEGRHRARLLLAPLNTDLLCVAFPVSGVLALPMSRPPRTDRHLKRRVPPCSRVSSRRGPLPNPAAVMLPPPPRLYLEAVQSVQTLQQAESRRWTQLHAGHYARDPTFPHAGKAISLTRVRIMVPPHQRADTQLQQPETQQSRQVTSLSVLSAGSEADFWRTDADATGSMVESSDGLGSTLPLEGTSPWFGLGGSRAIYDINDVYGDAGAIESSADSASGHESMIGVETYAARSPSTDLGAKEDFDIEKYVDW